MLTREQKRWMVIGFCTNTGDSVGCLMCKISHICESFRANYADFTDAELDACMEIIAPELVEEPKPVATPQWVSVANPPEKWYMDDEDKTLINYLVVGPICGVEIGNYVKLANMWLVMGLPTKVTHWMALPEPPERNA